MLLNYGKYQGWEIEQVPEDYVHYMIRVKREDLARWEEELTRREMIREAECSWVEKVIKAGHRDLAKRYHPDHGGSTTEMQAINAAAAQLMELLEQLKEPI